MRKKFQFHTTVPSPPYQPQLSCKLKTTLFSIDFKEEMKWDVRRTTDSVHPQELPEIQTDRGADPEWMGKAEEEIPF